MMIPRMITASAVAVALAGPALAAPQDITRMYDLYLGGLHGAEMELDARLDDEAFEARSELRTKGMVGLIFDGRYIVNASGKVVDGELEPGSFYADSAFRDDTQTVTVAYTDDRPEVISAEPAFRPRDYEIVPGEQVGTLDPMSAALALMRPMPVAEICRRTVDIFDGRRRTRISLGEPEVTSEGYSCPGVYSRVAGFSPKTMAKKVDYPFTVVFTEGPDGMAELYRASGPTGIGTAVILRRDPPEQRADAN